MIQEERELLEKFVVDNEDLEKLESELAKFNIFEAVGIVRQELHHSNFLAFLLNPSQNHRFDDVFLKRLLKRVLLEADEVTDLSGLKVSPVDIDIADLKDAEVYRKDILEGIDYEVTDSDELKQKVQAAWENFLSSDLPVIRELTTKVFEAELTSELLP